jgi:hypothetical protein
MYLGALLSGNMSSLLVRNAKRLEQRNRRVTIKPRW